MQADAIYIIASKIKSIYGFGAAVSFVRNVCTPFSHARLGPSAVFLASLPTLVFLLSCGPANLGMGHESA
jgi:hypothetical protein